jgi:hypothetical protein
MANLKNTLQQAANEALGKRKKRRHKRHLILWNGDIKNLTEDKKKAYLRYLTTRSETYIYNRIQKVSGNCEKRNKKN